MADKTDPQVPPVLVGWDCVSGLLPSVRSADAPRARTDKTHRNTWWMGVVCRAYEKDGDMTAWGTKGGTTERRPSRTVRRGHPGFRAARARVEIVRPMVARQAWW
jgi:hypothetical protein